MIKKVWLGILVIILAVPLLLISCTSGSSTSQSTTGSSATTSTYASTTSQGNWWSDFGTPQYGGTISVPLSAGPPPSFDTIQMGGGNLNFWYDSLFGKSLTVDRNTWSFGGMYTPDEYIVGNLVDTWEWTEPTTLILHLHQGIKFQNKEPVNGRELTAADVQSHYDRIMGTGGGYTTPAAWWVNDIANWEKVTTVDTYTVSFKFKKASAQNLQVIADPNNLNNIEAPEWVALGGNPGGAAVDPSPLSDWKTVVGSGPWMLTDFVSGSVISFTKNPDYWKTDARYPGNKIPYADGVKLIVIPDASTKIAAMRTQKIDIVEADYQQSSNLLKTNPDLVQKQIPMGSGAVNLIVNKSPFTDIRVRQALQMSVDRNAIAKSIYGGSASDNPSGMITQSYKGYNYAYNDWPQSLKDQYTYNPTAAKQLLAEAGYADGFDTNVVAGSDADMNLLQAFKAYFHDVGVEMEIKAMEVTVFGEYKKAGKCDQMCSDFAAWTWAPSRTIQLFNSKGSDAAAYGINDPPDAAYDALLDKFTAATEIEDAAGIIQQIDQYYLEQHWQVTGPEYYHILLWEPDIKGYSGEYFFVWGVQDLYSIMWIDQSLKK